MPAILSQQSECAHAPTLLSYCPDCGRLSYDAEQACDRCGGEALERVSHVGAIYSYTVVHRAAGPFVLSLVQLFDGPLVMGRVVGVDRELRIGLPVELKSGAEPVLASEHGGIVFGPLGSNYSVGKSTMEKEYFDHASNLT